MSRHYSSKIKIVEAATKLFSQYGFGKTTMQEIAAECDMSAANIYRFFDSKKDIIAEIVLETFRNDQDALRDVARKRGVDAKTKLEQFAQVMLRHTYELDLDSAKIREACDFICQQRFDLVKQHKEVKKSILAEILAEGIRNNEFDIDDILATAEDILNAIIICQYPVFATIYLKEDLERMAQGVTNLLFKGLRR